MAAFYSVGANCNLNYLDGLVTLGKTPTTDQVYKTLYDLFSVKSSFSRDRSQIQFQGKSCGYLIFHRGSDHAEYHYADKFADAITELKLGKVFKQEPAKNNLHGNREGILYVWIPDYQAISAFWHDYHTNNGVIGQSKKVIEDIRKKMDF